MLDLYKELLGITTTDYDKYIIISIIIISTFLFIVILNVFINILNNILGKE